MKRLFNLAFIIVIMFLFAGNIDASTTYIQGIVTGTTNIYTYAGSSTKMTNDRGNIMTLYKPEAVEVVGESGNYYQIKFLYSGFFYTGYVSKSVVKTATYTTDDAYEQSLINKGFPSDYAKKLAILHAIHPNWQFTPSYASGTSNGLDFYTAVNGEASVVARNLINSSNTSLRSTDDGAYQNGQWIALSGSGWYAASRQTIAFYMDPRNFLDESHIFMFENLGYNSATQTSETVDKILNGTFMNNVFSCTDSSNDCPVGIYSFRDTFMYTAQNKNVSPVHLATRVIQEQSSSGSVLSLGSGYNGQYVGYYNFFNINASGKTNYDVIMNGLTYAYNKGWNNQRKSIYDGSSLIANSYISRGQSTIYYQKFNTIVESFYGNQYMQNVQAPYSEAYNTYTSYYNSYSSQSEWNNATFDFLIPVYTNMGTGTTLDTSGNADATLKSLNVSSCSLNPSFQSSAYNYDCYVPLGTGSLSVSAEATNSLAKAEYSSNITLTSDNQSFEIKVTAANGNTSVYTVNVHRIETDGYSPTEVLNGVGIKTDGGYISNIALGSDISNIGSSVRNQYHFATVNSSKASGTASTGNTVTVNNAGVSSTFTIVIYGDTTGDGAIDIRDLLAIQKHLIKSKTLSNAYNKAADINKDGKIDIRDLLLEQKYLVGAYNISQG